MTDYSTKFEEYENSYNRPNDQKINNILKKVDHEISKILLREEKNETLDALYKVKEKLLKSDLNWAITELERIIDKNIEKELKILF
jgi:hypothetical protein